MSDFTPTARTRIHRCAHKASYDQAAIYQALDSIPECTIACVDPLTHLPRLMVTSHWRVGDDLYIHGGVGSAFYKLLNAGAPVAVSVSATDGLVLARSAFETSVQFRSVMIYGQFTAITDVAQQLQLLEAFYQHLLPGRWNEIRKPSAKELAATYVMRLPIQEAVAKLSTGMPDDKEEDLQTPSWGGVLPYLHQWGAVESDALSVGISLPASVAQR
jgi:nitroimidazol reductase NimA-like FMN-containing flavoprotein (pyridoxamine 5'-phosphate oxidase superfamily)